jgi:membrane protein
MAQRSTQEPRGERPAGSTPDRAQDASPEVADARGNPLPEEAPAPQPEREEPALRDPGMTDLSTRDYLAIVRRALKEALDDNVTNLAAAVAYNAFLAIPSALLVALGALSVFGGPSAVRTIMDHLSSVMPASAVSLLGGSLTRTTQAHNGGLAMIVVGLVLALWSLSGAMQTVMWALNMAYERTETRGFVKKRLSAIAMIACTVLAFALVFVLLVLGPVMTGWIGSAVGNPTVVSWVWWVAQWPILIMGLLAMFAVVLYLAPNVALPRWKLITPGAVFAVLVWLLASAAFAFYTSRFSSYNKAWGSLAAVIIMLTWLWLSALALLLGGEINAEAERSRELRRGEPAERELQAPARD